MNTNVIYNSILSDTFSTAELILTPYAIEKFSMEIINNYSLQKLNNMLTKVYYKQIYRN